MDHATLSINDLQAFFAEETTAAGGTIVDSVVHASHWYARSVLPDVREVTPGDGVQGGVAVRGTVDELMVHPYLFRQVCKNGEIRAHAIESRQLAGLSSYAPVDAADLVRSAIRACSQPAVFARSTREMQGTLGSTIDSFLYLFSMVRIATNSQRTAILAAIGAELARSGDRSAFGLMNAVTATARTTADPELRWQLEELGGAIPLAIGRHGPRPPLHAVMATDDSSDLFAGSVSVGKSS